MTSTCFSSQSDLAAVSDLRAWSDTCDLDVVRFLRVTEAEEVELVNCLTATMQSSYFDTALSAPSGFPSLLAFARRGHVVFGTDYPYASEAVSKKFTQNMGNYDQFREHELDETNQHALSLFPRLKTHGTDVNESRNLAVTEVPRRA